LTDGTSPQTGRVTGVAVEGLVGSIVAGEGKLVGVDDDDEVTSVDVRRECWLMLAAEQVCRLDREAAEHHVGGVDDVPLMGHVSGLRCVRRHRSPSSIVSLLACMPTVATPGGQLAPGRGVRRTTGYDDVRHAEGTLYRADTGPVK